MIFSYFLLHLESHDNKGNPQILRITENAPKENVRAKNRLVAVESRFLIIKFLDRTCPGLYHCYSTVLAKNNLMFP